MSKRNVLNLMAASIAGLATLAGAQDYTNKLTPMETSAGYDLLFNGSAITGWHGYKMSTVPDAWFPKTNTPLGPRIENGNGNKQYLMTDKKYKNFDFKFEVQVPANANSGVFIRYEEIEASPMDHRSGPETQICGSSDLDCASSVHFFGACYDMFGPKIQNWYNPAGQWNQLRIIAFDSNIVHYGNGKKLVDYKIGSPEFLAAYAKSKYASDGNNGRYYDIHPGSIMLQHHGEIGVTFRNLRAKELTVHPFKQEFKSGGKWPDTLSMDFVFGAPTALQYSQSAAASQQIEVSSVGSHATLVKVTGAHKGLEVLSIDGRAMVFRKTAEGSYLIERNGMAPGLAVVRVRFPNATSTKIIDLP